MPDSSLPSDRPAPGTPYEVPVQGSLALLALGARGLEAWRAKRAEAGDSATDETPPILKTTPRNDQTNA